MNEWSLEDIKNGFDRYLKINGSLPTTPEIDKCEYLPSSRTIQRRFGGVIELRKKLGYNETHFGIGKYRKKLSNQAYTDGLSAEKQVEKYLIEKFGEPFVHIEKRIGSKKNRIDFYVYSPSNNLAIDVFSPNSFRDLQKNVNIKIDKFVDLLCPTIYLPINENLNFKQKKINKWIKNKRKKMPPNSFVYNFITFKHYVEKMDIYYNPLDDKNYVQNEKSF
jgi:hypothetical protein